MSATGGGCANGATEGCWSTLLDWSFSLPHAHAALVPTGSDTAVVWKTLMWDFGGYNAQTDETVVTWRLWDWASGFTPNLLPLRISGSGRRTIFCSGHSLLQDGRLLLDGGDFLSPPPIVDGRRGPRHTYAFNGLTGLDAPPAWSVPLAELQDPVCAGGGPECRGGRYYPGQVTVVDPRFALPQAFSVHGLNIASPPGSPVSGFIPNRRLERYNPGANPPLGSWTVEDPTTQIPIDPREAQYPWLHVLPLPHLPQGNPPYRTTVFFSGHYSGVGEVSSKYAHKLEFLGGPNPWQWTSVGTWRLENRINGTSVLLPLKDVDPPGLFEGGRILTVGGNYAFEPDSVVSKTAEFFCADPVAPSSLCPPLPQGAVEGWRTAPDMAEARQHANVVVLPDGTVVIIGGESVGNCDFPKPAVCPDPMNQTRCVPVMTAELYQPATQTWVRVTQPHDRPRQYHSVGVLQRDGSVLSAGGETDARCVINQVAGPTAQVYLPPYFFRGPRAGITQVSRRVLQAGDVTPVTVTIDQAAVTATTKVVLMRAASVTHSFSSDQRAVELRVTGFTGTTLSVRPPSNANLAPPGYYLLFVVTQDGQMRPLPSKYGEWVQVRL